MKALTALLALFFLFISIGIAAEVEAKVDTLKLKKQLPAEEEDDVYFKNPAEIEVDDNGNVYAFDPNTHHFIYKISPEGRLIIKIGRPGQGPGDLFRPRLMRIEQDKIFIVDMSGLSIFDLDGNYKGRFRLFNDLISFDVKDGKIYTVESGTKKLFSVYNFHGKKIGTFGIKYHPDPSKSGKYENNFIDGCLHGGNVLCGDNCVMFISRVFGDIHLFDYEGNLIKKESVPIFKTDIIKKNWRVFAKAADIGAHNISTTCLYVDVYYLDSRLFFLSLAKKNYDEIIELDNNNLSVKERLRIYVQDKTEEEFSSCGLAVTRKNSARQFIVSMLEMVDRNISIDIYEKEVNP